MTDELRAAQLTAQARFSADRQKLDDDLSLPFAATTEQRIARGRRLAAYKLPDVVETSEEMAAKLAERERAIAAEIEALRNPPIEQRFARLVGKAYSGCRLDNFQIAPDWPMEAREQAGKVLGCLKAVSGSIRDAVAHCRGLVLYGDPGVGKDHLIVGVMWSAMQADMRCKYTNGGKFAALAMDQFGDARQPERIWLEEWTKPDILTISDPDGNRQSGLTDHVRDTLQKVVDARCGLGKPTWITINGHDPGTFAARLSERTWDRLLHKAWLLHCSWPGSRRPRGVV